jgi:hypothetical protein
VIHDAIIPVYCDGADCGEHFNIDPDYCYPDFSGKGGHYDTSDAALDKKIKAENWEIRGDKHYCPDCTPPED